MNNGENNDKEIDKPTENLILAANEIFESGFWQKYKHEVKDLSKRDVCRYMFTLGFITNNKMINEEIKRFEGEAKKDPKMFEDALKAIKDKMGKREEQEMEKDG